MTWRIMVDWLPDNDESRAVHLAHGRICHLEHAEGSPTSDMHAYFETKIPEGWSLLNDSDRANQCVATTILKAYPRFEGSIWDLLAAALVSAHRGWPVLTNGTGD